MKIAYCILGTFSSGGIERVLANKANALVKLNVMIWISIICPDEILFIGKKHTIIGIT